MKNNSLETATATNITSSNHNTMNIKSLIHIVRNQQVMIDSDLANLYNVETKRLNESVKRNSKRFPNNFCFQLTEDEYSDLRSQFATSNGEIETSNKGGRRYLPYVFTEQGIAMLSAVLRSDEAIQVSINIMNAFVEMRHFIANNAMMFERISKVELRQLEYENTTNEKLNKIFEYISDHEESTQKVFFDGQIFDAFSLISTLIQKATKDIILIDGYVDTKTLDLLSKKKSGVLVEIHTFKKGCKLTNTEISNFNIQYPALAIHYTNNFHDRFLILDHTTGYHIGASIKDAGKKCFAISLLEDNQIIQDIINRL